MELPRLHRTRLPSHRSSGDRDGILVHPSYQDELVNGVAVSFDPVRGRAGNYYVNSQVGEDLVTNPDAHSVPEETPV